MTLLVNLNMKSKKLADFQKVTESAPTKYKALEEE